MFEDEPGELEQGGVRPDPQRRVFGALRGRGAAVEQPRRRRATFPKSAERVLTRCARSCSLSAVGRWRLLVLVLAAVGATAWLLWGRTPAGAPGSNGGVEGGLASHEEAPIGAGVEIDDGPSATGPSLAGAAPSAAAGRMEGLVLDSATNQPIPGARVFAFRMDGEGSVLEADTDTEGRFAVEDLEPGTWVATAWHPHYVPAFLENALGEGWSEVLLLRALVIVAPGKTAQRTLRLERGARIAGRVVDLAGRPIPGAQVRAARFGERLAKLAQDLPGDAAGWMRRLSTKCDAEGRFEVSWLPKAAGATRWVAALEGHVGRIGEPVEGSIDAAPVALELLLVPAAGIDGRAAYPDGVPLQAVEIGVVEPDREAGDSKPSAEWDWQCDAVAVDAVGAFELRGLPPTRIVLEVRPVGSEASPHRKRARGEVARYDDPHALARSDPGDLVAGSVRAGVLVVVPRSFPLTVRLLSTLDGRPVAGERLSLRPEESGTDAAAPAGVMGNDVSTDEQGTATWTRSDAGPYRVVHLTPGRERALVENLVLPRELLEMRIEPTPRRSVAVRVLDPRGRPVPSFRTTLLALGMAGEDHPYQSSVLGSDGHAIHEIAGEGPFEWTVASRGSPQSPLPDLCDYEERIAAIPATNELEVRLLDEGFLRVRVVDGEGRPVVGAQVLVGREVEDGGKNKKEKAWTPLAASEVVWKADDKIKRLRVVPPGGWLPPRDAIPSRSTGVHTFVLAGAGRIGGRVVVPPGTRLEPGPLLTASWDGSLVADDWEYWEESELAIDVDEQGHFLCDGLPAGVDLTLSVDRPEARRRGLQAPAIEGLRTGQLDIEVRVDAGLSITLEIKSGGPPPSENYREQTFVLGGNPHFFQGGSVLEEGSFEFRGLAPGRYEAYYWRHSDVNDWVEYALGEVEAGETLEVNLARWGMLLLRGAANIGSIQIFASKPNHGERILLGQSRPPYELLRVPSDGTYDVLALTSDGLRAAFAAGVRANMPFAPTFQPTVQLGGRFAGRGPTADWQLEARSKGATFIFKPYLVSWPTDYQFEGRVFHGRCDIVARHRDGTTHVLARDVAAGRTDLVLRMP